MADEDDDIWSPGSFTKNFSWGEISNGLVELHRAIRTGFQGRMEDTERSVFRERIDNSGRPGLVPINFFLFNTQRGGVDFIIADELVFQALSYDHSERFDRLALFAFNFSFAGRWKGARRSQRRPALWANAYVRLRVAEEFGWNASRIDADDIEAFIRNRKEYTGKTTRKVSTNLAYLYRAGGLEAYASPRIERWWVDALFLALDRLIEDRRLDGEATPEAEFLPRLTKLNFLPLTGKVTLEKRVAMPHLVTLYQACGGRTRFVDDLVFARIGEVADQIERYIANDDRPRGAIHPTNPRILKSIPAVCVMLAIYAGFDVIDPDEMENFDVEDFVRRRTTSALENLRANGIVPSMTWEELMEITREP